MIASLPGSHLDHLLRGRCDVANPLAFIDRQSERLFAINIFTGSASVHQHFCMPVIRSSNQHDIDVIRCQQIYVALKQFRSTAKRSASLFTNVTINIANGHHITVFTSFLCNHGALITQTDGSNPRAFHGMPRHCCGGSGKRHRRNKSQCGKSRCCLKSLATRRCLRHHKSPMNVRLSRAVNRPIRRDASSLTLLFLALTCSSQSGWLARLSTNRNAIL